MQSEQQNQFHFLKTMKLIKTYLKDTEQYSIQVQEIYTDYSKDMLNIICKKLHNQNQQKYKVGRKNMNKQEENQYKQSEKILNKIRLKKYDLKKEVFRLAEKINHDYRRHNFFDFKVVHICPYKQCQFEFYYEANITQHEKNHEKKKRKKISQKELKERQFMDKQYDSNQEQF